MDESFQFTITSDLGIKILYTFDERKIFIKRYSLLIKLNDWEKARDSKVIIWQNPWTLKVTWRKGLGSVNEFKDQGLAISGQLEGGIGAMFFYSLNEYLNCSNFYLFFIQCCCQDSLSGWKEISSKYNIITVSSEGQYCDNGLQG